MEYHSASKKRYPAICNNKDGSRGCNNAQWYKPGGERWKPYDSTCLWNIKPKQSIRTMIAGDSKTLRRDWWSLRGTSLGRECEGDRGAQKFSVIM